MTRPTLVWKKCGGVSPLILIDDASRIIEAVVRWQQEMIRRLIMEKHKEVEE